jgi:hypothetical protein
MLSKILLGIGILTISDVIIKILVVYFIAPKIGEKLIKVLITFIGFSTFIQESLKGINLDKAGLATPTEETPE